MQILLSPQLFRILTFLKHPLRNTYVRAVVYAITMKPRHPPRVRRTLPPVLKPVQPNQSPASRLYPKAAAPSAQCGLIKPVPFPPLLPGQSPLSSIITAPDTCHISQPHIPRPNKIKYIPVVSGQSPMSSLLAPRHSDCYMLDAPEQAPLVAARGSISASLALVVCLVAAALPYVLASRRIIVKHVATILSFNPVSAHDAHSDVADDNDTSTITSDDGNVSLVSTDSEVTLVEHESVDEARGASGTTVDGLLFKISTRELKIMVIAQDDAHKMADDALVLKDNIAIVEEIQQTVQDSELPIMKSIVDHVTVCDVDQTSDVIEEGGESPLERVSVVHKARASRRDKKRRKRGRKPGRKLLRRLMAMA